MVNGEGKPIKEKYTGNKTDKKLDIRISPLQILHSALYVTFKEKRIPHWAGDRSI